ncbi:MAG: ParB/RepB/Spo0J family partition protein [bacterium]|nr:ParB/RepB/Spo0J family partition protein [bacterium]
MSDSLGRGLESLIPEKSPEEVPESFTVPEEEASKSELAIDPQASVVPSGQAFLTSSTPAVEQISARSYQDNFTPRRSESVFWIEIEKIESNPFQPRREFDPEALKDLSSSIREHGIIQPLLVTKREFETPTGLEVKYQLIAGERRWRAAQLAGLSQVPAVVRRGMPDDRIKLELALIENIQREDLNAFERAKAFKQLMDEFHLMHKEVAARVGKSREMVSNTLRLLTLPQEIQESLSKGRLNEGQARAVLMVGDDQSKQMEVYTAILSDDLSVREAENKARQVGGRTLVPRKRHSQIQDPELRDLQNKLQEKLGTKVQFQKMGDKGKIVVEFYSEEELRSILDKLT